MNTDNSKKGADHSAPFSFGSSGMGPRNKSEDDRVGNQPSFAMSASLISSFE
jgi:hypothetical protein